MLPSAPPRTLPAPKLSPADARAAAVAGLKAFAASTFGKSLPPDERQALAAARLDAANLARRIEGNLHRGPVLVEIRGYYGSQGVPGANDRGLWDDVEVLIWIDGAQTAILAAIRANVDPSFTRNGMACKVAPQHYRVREGRHRNRRALRQAAPVLIDRDGPGGVEYRTDPSRWPYTNVHDDQGAGTGSAGCSTAPPLDYAILYTAAAPLGTIDVVLIDETARRGAAN